MKISMLSVRSKLLNKSEVSVEVVDSAKGISWSMIINFRTGEVSEGKDSDVVESKEIIPEESPDSKED